jgi:hypothetical protein
MPTEFSQTDYADVIVMSIIDPVHTNEIMDAFIKAADYAQNVPGKVFAILDCSRMKLTGTPVGAAKVQNTELVRDGQKYYLIAVGMSTIGQVMGEFVMRITGQNHIKYVKSMDAAWQLIDTLRDQV